MSEGTHLPNFAGDKQEWLVYITIGNLSSMISQTPSTHYLVMVALLPIPIKNRYIPENRLDDQRQIYREVLNKVLQWVLPPFTCTQHPSANSGYYNVPCANGNYRHCKPVSATWLAECLEYSDLHDLEQHVCFWCEWPKKEPGDDLHPDKQHHRRNHNLYTVLRDAKTKAADAELSWRHDHKGFNMIRHIPCIWSDLPKPDLLHAMHIGMLDHHQRYIFCIMKTDERLNKYNALWLYVPVYRDLTPKNKSYDEVSQWNGKKMNKISRYLLGVVTQSLPDGNPTQHPISNCTIECTRALLIFYMYT
jgi:hypothetical protein